jgi:hypothetical protein
LSRSVEDFDKSPRRTYIHREPGAEIGQRLRLALDGLVANRPKGGVGQVP